MTNPFSLVPTAEQQHDFDDPVLSPVAASLVTARALQANGDRISEVFHNRDAVDTAMQHITQVAQYWAVKSMTSHAADIEHELATRPFDRYPDYRAEAEKAALTEALEDARRADALPLPELDMDTLMVATTALAIETFVDDAVDQQHRIAAVEATDVMTQYMPQAWESLTGHPEMPEVIVGQVAAQPLLLQ